MPAFKPHWQVVGKLEELTRLLSELGMEETRTSLATFPLVFKGRLARIWRYGSPIRHQCRHQYGELFHCHSATSCWLHSCAVSGCVRSEAVEWTR